MKLALDTESEREEVERISISEDQEKIGKTKLEPKREGILKQDRSGIKGLPRKELSPE